MRPSPRHLSALLVSAALLVACASSSVSSGRVNLSKADARKNNLTAMGFEFSLAPEIDWTTHLFPDPGVYFTASGPPGGPLFLQMRSFRRTGPAADALRDRLRRRGLPDLRFGSETKVLLAGEPRLAQPYAFGSADFPTYGCDVLLNDRDQADRGCIVTFWVGLPPETEPDCRLVLASRDLAPTAKSLTIR